MPIKQHLVEAFDLLDGLRNSLIAYDTIGSDDVIGNEKGGTFVYRQTVQKKPFREKSTNQKS